MHAQLSTHEPSAVARSCLGPPLAKDPTGSVPAASGQKKSPTPADWISIYLSELEQHCQKETAARAAGVCLRTVQRYRKENRSFAEAEADAMAVAADLVESEITRRAIYGTTTEQRHRDGSVTVKTQYSDLLLLRLAEKIESGRWRQKQLIEHSGSHKTFATRAERVAELNKVRREMGELPPEEQR